MRVALLRIWVLVSWGLALALISPGHGYGGSDPRTGLSYTAARSKAAGLFVCSVTATPKKFAWKLQSYEFHEVWVEKRTRPKRRAEITLRNWEVADGYRLCFNLKTGRERAQSDNDGPLQMFEVRIDGDEVQVGPALPLAE